jgi:hypothetical protein
MASEICSLPAVRESEQVSGRIYVPPQLLFRRRYDPLVGSEHCVCEAALLFSEDQSVGRVIRRLCGFDDGMLFGPDVAGNNGGEVVAGVPGKRIFGRSPLVNHQAFNIY